MWKTEKNITNYFALIFSIAIHFVFGSYYIGENYIFNNQSNLKDLKEYKQRKIEIKKISQKEIKRIKDKLQIVQNTQSHKVDELVKSKFSGESNQKVDRQTIARNVGKFEAESIPEISIKNKKTNNLKNQNKKLDIQHLNLGSLGTFTITQAKKELEDHSLIKDVENEERKVERKIASTNDFVEDVPLGDTTNLNTTENKYYSFYSRIRQKLEQHWGSSIHEQARKLYKNGRRIASDNLITSIVVVLSDKGQIVDIKIEGTSGIRELDQVAVESFNKAGPFPNPPKGLVVDGRAVIQWGFVVKS